MDTELIRYRVERDIRDQALAVCAKAGVSLGDVLRAFTARLAREQRLPPDLAGVVPTATARTPFGDYEPRLWEPILPIVSLDLALWVAGSAAATSALAAPAAGATDPAAHANAMAALAALYEQPSAQAVQTVLTHHAGVAARVGTASP